MVQSTLEKLAESLNKRKIPYMVIGGQAVLVYGEPRLTRDIDLTLGRDIDSIEEILSVVKSQGWKVLTKDPRKFAEETMVLPCEDPISGMRIDFVFSRSSYETQALSRSKRMKMGGIEVSFVSPEDLIIYKIIAGRPRDLEDVKSILAKNKGLDLNYVRKWLSDFERELNRSFLPQFESLKI